MHAINRKSEHRIGITDLLMISKTRGIHPSRFVATYSEKALTFDTSDVIPMERDRVV